jgi:uncharacterized cupin superfamily protein
MVEEARMQELPTGLRPATQGWFVVNVRDAWWLENEKFGSSCTFEGEWPDAWFAGLGVRVNVLQPGQPNCLYHRENQQEGFLVLRGECTLVVEGEERGLEAWDFVHCPPDTEHVVVGVGDGPCAILMVGVRSEQEQLHYAVSEVAARHGASVESATSSPDDAYAPTPKWDLGRPASWDDLPWG